jgi:hypothetical protein
MVRLHDGTFGPKQEEVGPPRALEKTGWFLSQMFTNQLQMLPLMCEAANLDTHKNAKKATMCSALSSAQHVPLDCFVHQLLLDAERQDLVAEHRKRFPSVEQASISRVQLVLDILVKDNGHLAGI